MNHYIVTDGDGTAVPLDKDESEMVHVLNDVTEVKLAMQSEVRPQIYMLVPLPHTAAVDWLEKLATEGKSPDYILRECAVRNADILEWPPVSVDEGVV